MQGAGKIRRITAAILVNHRMMVNGKQVSWQSRSPEEMSRLTQLAQATVGFDAVRGDQVNVEDMAFEDHGAPEPPLGERLLRTASQSEALLKYATILLAMAALLVFVVRPVMGKMKSAPSKDVRGAIGDPALGAGEGEPQLSPEQLTAEKQKQHAQAIFEHVTNHLRREPAQSTRLLQSWIHSQ
jgi:flagellar M-ring protein FliF